MSSYYLGIDVSKGYSDFVILDEHKTEAASPFQLDDTYLGHQCLYKFLKDFISSHPECELYCGIESTGGYENNWFLMLHQLQVIFPIQVARLNPMGVHNSQKADLKRTITDQISARGIAEYLMRYPEKVNYTCEDYYGSLRKQWKYVVLLSKQKTQLRNHLESLIYSAFPEILSYCKHGMPQWVLKLLMGYPTAKRVGRARVSSLANIPYLSKKRAAKLKEMAKKSVASASDDTHAQLIQNIAKQILSLKRQIEKQLQLIIHQCPMQEITLLKSFIGISDFSAIGLILEIGAPARFATVKKLASFFGIHPIYKQSGDGTWGTRMSKNGRVAPRAILYMVALCAIDKNPLIKQIYQRHLDKGMNKSAAIGACMHKILRIIYGMLKHNKAFDPKIDQINQNKAKQKNKKVKIYNNQKWQNYDENAPISRKQTKKRKEQKMSQNERVIKNGIVTAAP